MAVRYIGKGGYTGLSGCPIGHVFKAVEFKVADCPHLTCVHIRGSSLAKATGEKKFWTAKKYVFVLGFDNSDMELINEV
jgi:hypothetical protein